jgi:hypothetical protein
MEVQQPQHHDGETMGTKAWRALRWSARGTCRADSIELVLPLKQLFDAVVSVGAVTRTFPPGHGPPRG